MSLRDFLCVFLCITQDQAALRKYLDRENALELPPDEEVWEVPAPKQVEVKKESNVPVVCPFGAVQEEEVKTDQNKDNRLVCWPPKASLNKTGGGSSGSQAVEDVMKMWPPPAAPSLAPMMATGHSGSGMERSSSNMNVHQRTGIPPVHVDLGPQHVQGPTTSESTSRTTDRPGRTEMKEEPTVQDIKVHPQPVKSNADEPEGTPHHHKTKPTPTAVEQDTPETPTPPGHNTTQVPEMVSSQFQGGETLQRPLVSLDNAVWTKPMAPEAVLEDLELDCTLPQTLVISKDFDDTACIGQWGEQLVFSFLTHWKENGGDYGPIEITWFNEKGESGQPCDFKLTFAIKGPRTSTTREIFVEVKTTIKRERHFIHLSANELDFALKEKERYHIYRVYGAGDAQNVRLCRIKNLAQHLHSKALELFLFV
ncbi:uncharacterized protein wu:fj29h11 isoform X1 [Triplophysa rosa]|uniref:Protein NO VEIN C-terminal domain-containing protein n=1 Tax=Triplophysa rosa TaxID=992332 RepID=A0A9W7TIE7_TRIRA|nr:uncharacterized protein wu:fj29h11 isoform X1 [Triplophysa rosa]KAI7797001.1 hypothetical protein IRJ41_010949 [Triplophysa rosa]